MGVGIGRNLTRWRGSSRQGSINLLKISAQSAFPPDCLGNPGVLNARGLTMPRTRGLSLARREASTCMAKKLPSRKMGLSRKWFQAIHCPRQARYGGGLPPSSANTTRHKK